MILVPELLWENILDLSCPTEEAPLQVPEAVDIPVSLSSLLPPQAGPDHSQSGRPVGLSPLLPPAPDKCVISSCSLMETREGAANGINTAVPFC